MKLLIDQNNSFRIVHALANDFGNVAHVKSQGLLDTNDYDIFIFARQHDFDAVVTLDADFRD